MGKEIEVVVSPDGKVKIDAKGFEGADCEAATLALERELGAVTTKVAKPERFRQHKSQAVKQ